MNRRTLLLIILPVLIVLGVSAVLLNKPSAPTPTPESEVPATETAVEEESVPVVLPVVATATTESTASLKTAEVPRTATLIVEGTSLPIHAPAGATIEEAMAKLKAEGTLAYTLRSYTGLGAFVKEINGKSDTSEYYWILYVNGKKSATGISATRISSGDVIEWKYEHKY